ncbi:MAG: ABC transporter permease, partial [Syntrophobacteraceae bacterium]
MMRADIVFSRPSEGSLEIGFSGSWTLVAGIPDVEKTRAEIGDSRRTQRVSFQSGDLTGWDSSLLVFLTDIYSYCSDRGIGFDDRGLPPGITRLLKLAFSVPPTKDARSKKKGRPLLEMVGAQTVSMARSTGEMLGFLGETFLAFTRIFTGKARFRRSDLLYFIQECGHEAVPIVSLISALVGLILAFTGAVQLLLFGAQIYVA